jgi:ubiquinone/menaquinone biosynthesis C-methylase UbiE
MKLFIAVYTGMRSEAYLMTVKYFFHKLKTLGVAGVLDVGLYRVLVALVPDRLRLPLWRFDSWYRYKNARRLLASGINGEPCLVLDVGGGAGDFAIYASKLSYFASVVVCEPNPRSATPSAQRGVLTVRASGTALPFANGSFRYVTCLHVLEHVPWTKRQQFISELARVCSQKLVLICPEGEHAEALSRSVIGFCERFGFQAPDMTLQHLACRVPRYQEIITCFDLSKWKVWYFRSRNYHLDLMYFDVMQIPVFRFFAHPLLLVPMLLLSGMPPQVELTLVASREIPDIEGCGGLHGAKAR